jgi:hypothetical protein
VLLVLGGKTRSGCGCVVVGSIELDLDFARACLSLDLVGWVGQGDWWRSGRGWRGQGGRRGGQVGVGVSAEVEVEVVGMVRIEAVGVVVAIDGWVAGLGRDAAVCRMVALVVGSGMC